MLELESAQANILALLPPPQAERVPLGQAAGRILMEPVRSPIDLPRFDNSAMDGYAVRAVDVAGASAASPVKLRLAGSIPAGASSSHEVEAGSCMRIFTGSVLPAGADAVVMQEDTRREESDSVWILDAAKPWENVRFRGQDVKAGAEIAAAGAPLTAGRVSVLAATGCDHVQVARRPVIALLATGDELREPGEPLGAGQIYESNRLVLAQLLNAAGAVPKLYPLVPDTLAGTRAALAKAFSECDAVVTTGGVSVGELDFVKAAFEELGGKLDFWKVAIKPGKPFVFGHWEHRFLFGLPGNPVSAVVTFLLLVRPAILRWQGAAEVQLPAQIGDLAEALSNPGGRRHFMRVVMDDAGQVRSAGLQASHALLSLAAANGLVDVPPDTTLPAGARVKVWRWS